MNGAIKTKTLDNVLIQENGIIRDVTGLLIGRLVDDVKFENLESRPVDGVVSREVGGQPEPNFVKEIERVINSFSKENDSNTPDFILAEYLNNCLNNFTTTSRAREKWYGKELHI